MATRTVVGVVDHLVVAAPDLDEVDILWQAATGVKPTPGGAHDGMGTRNILVGLDDGRYIEIMGPDPDAEPTEATANLRALPGPALYTFAVLCHDLDALAPVVAAEGLRLDVIELSRVTPAGERVSFRYAPMLGHDFGPVVPFFIEWGETRHPATTLPVETKLTGVRVGHPDAAGVADLLRRVGIEGIDVDSVAEPVVSAVLDTPQGRVALRSAPTLFGAP